MKWSFLTALLLGFVVYTVAPLFGASVVLSAVIGAAVAVVFYVVDAGRPNPQDRRSK